MTRIIVIAAGLALAGAPAAAADFQLASGNSTLKVSTEKKGAFVWYIDQAGRDHHDAVDNLFMSTYMFRTGSGGETGLSALGAATVIEQSADAITLGYSNGSLAATVNWRVTGGAEGSGRSTLSKSVSFTNLGGEAVDLTLFDYSDYDINFDQFRQADQSALVGDGHIVTRSATIPSQIDSIVSVRPDHHQISDFFTLYSALFLDRDGATTLNDTPAPDSWFPTPARDNAFALQWTRTLAAGQSFSVGQVATYGPAVPEPASWAMMIAGFALAGSAIRRRRGLPRAA